MPKSAWLKKLCLFVLFQIFFFSIFAGSDGGTAQEKSEHTTQRQEIKMPKIFPLDMSGDPAKQESSDASAKRLEPIRSNISFSAKKNKVKINFANIEKTDPLISCPLTDIPADLVIMVEQLKTKTADFITQVDKARDAKCVDLQNRVTDYSVQIKLAIQNQFLAINAAAARASQNVVNLQTQQASAVSGLLLLASDMMIYKCLHKIDDRVVLQKLAGQLTMLSGLFVGGWEGIGLAATGQLFANLPLFRDDIEASESMVLEYDEKNRRAEFMCFFRQMLKMSVLLFVDKDTEKVSGLDLQFRNGPVKTTIDSIKNFHQQQPADLANMKLLDKINQESTLIFADLEKWDPKTENPLPLYNKFGTWCEKNNAIFSSQVINVLESKSKDISLLPRISVAGQGDESKLSLVMESIRRIDNMCREIRSLDWRLFRREHTADVVDEAYWQFKTIRTYYQNLKDDQKSPLGHILRTLFSLNYFEGLKKSVESYKNDSGNQLRLNFLKLVNGVAAQLAKKSFKTLMKQNYKILAGHRIQRNRNIESLAIKRRALFAMLDLCLTLDPTVAHFNIEKPHRRTLFYKWRKYCVAPPSLLCKSALHSPEISELLDNDRYRIYFNSLCRGEDIESKPSERREDRLSIKQKIAKALNAARVPGNKLSIPVTP